MLLFDCFHRYKLSARCKVVALAVISSKYYSRRSDVSFDSFSKQRKIHACISCSYLMLLDLRSFKLGFQGVVITHCTDDGDEERVARVSQIFDEESPRLSKEKEEIRQRKKQLFQIASEQNGNGNNSKTETLQQLKPHSLPLQSYFLCSRHRPPPPRPPSPSPGHHSGPPGHFSARPLLGSPRR